MGLTLPHVRPGRHKVKITPRHDRDGNDPFHLHAFKLQSSRGFPFVLKELTFVALTPIKYSIHNMSKILRPQYHRMCYS